MTVKKAGGKSSAELAACAAERAAKRAATRVARDEEIKGWIAESDAKFKTEHDAETRRQERLRKEALRVAEEKYPSALWLKGTYIQSLHAKRTAGDSIICNPRDKLWSGDVVEVEGARFPIHDLSRRATTMGDLMAALRTKRPDLYSALAEVVRDLCGKAET